MNTVTADVVVVGSGAGGGTVAKELVPLVQSGKRVLVLERGPRFRDEEFDGRELEMAEGLYLDSGGFLTSDGAMTLAVGQAYGGSTVTYTGTSMYPPDRIIEAWNVPGLRHDDLMERARKYVRENNVHLLPEKEINDNNRLFFEGARAAGFSPEQFPVNVKGCLGSSLCNLGCPNGAKQGTHKVQLPEAEAGGVEVVTRADVLEVGDRRLKVRVRPKASEAMGTPSEWEPGDYLVKADVVVLAGGVLGTPPLLFHSGFDSHLPRLGQGFTCHPAFILVGEHAEEITNDVGHPKSFFVDRGEEEGYVLETCMYFPFVTAKNLTGFGTDHAVFMDAYPRLQMILVLACDRAILQNRVVADRAGNPIVHYRFTKAVKESLAAATRAAARIFFASGAVRVHAPLADPPRLEKREADRIDSRVLAKHFLPGSVSVSAAHLMGGAGMGVSIEDSVTDSWGKVHGYPWLRVADASLFPDALEINPYLTIMALADRVAEGVLETYS
ncbi:MAG: GMC family oxidoreductase [Gemmatimonadetes bacterium]|nr:GMC family oxidoreductase N-terminal domain-containing protein [Gemmatimonadota bacterium]NNM06843.1 GMC family oxidoreductase [Gemmatimonadota bacterium]